LKKLYSIYDRKMNVYMTPMYVTDIIEVTRQIYRALQDENSLLSQFPEDYEIYFLGEWHENHGLHKSLDKPQFELNITSLKKGVESGS